MAKTEFLDKEEKMSLLSYTELCELIEQGVIDAPLEHVNSSSIDLTFDDKILIRKICDGTAVWIEKNLKNGPYELAPGEFILASSKEYFNLPLDLSAEYKLKSSQARQGINHFTAGWADAGWHGKLTLEIINHDLVPVDIEAGKKAGQMIFHRHAPVPFEKSYAARGQYNGQKSVQASKGIR